MWTSPGEAPAFPGTADKPESLRQEETDWDRRAREEAVKDTIQDREERKKYAKHYFWLVALWMAFMGAILVAQGFQSDQGVFKLSDNVLMMALGTTTAKVVAIIIIVARHLFPEPDKRTVG